MPKNEDKIKLPANADGTEYYAPDEDTARLFAEQEGVAFDTRGKKGKNATVDRVGTAFVVRTGKPTSDDVVNTAHRRAASNADADADFQPTQFTAGPTVQNLDAGTAAEQK